MHLGRAGESLSERLDSNGQSNLKMWLMVNTDEKRLAMSDPSVHVYYSYNVCCHSECFKVQLVHVSCVQFYKALLQVQNNNIIEKLT